MSDSENDDTYISFSSICRDMETILELKKDVDATFKNFTNKLNQISSSIILFKRQLKKQKTNVNDSNRSSDQGKKKICCNVNNDARDDYECNNNNNTIKKSRERSLYYPSDKQGRLEFKKGKTELEKAELLLQYHSKHVENIRQKEDRRKEKENKNLEEHVNYPVTTSDTSSIICSNSSSDSSSNISSTSSLIIPAPDSKETIIKITSTHGKLPKTFNSHKPNAKWKQIDRNEALEKIDKIKRKRDQNVLQPADPTNVYIDEFPEDSSDNHYSDDDVDADNYDHVNLADANATQLNQQSATAPDAGAFESDAVLPAQNNNKIYKK
jgi:hypothetical protein